MAGHQSVHWTCCALVGVCPQPRPPFLHTGTHIQYSDDACLTHKKNRTNITEPGASYASSRGTLVAAFLADPRGDSDLASATTALTAEDASYAGFNLLLLEPHPRLSTTTTGPEKKCTASADAAPLAYDARLVTNGGGGGHIRARTLSDDERACGGVSNGVDGEGGDAWPKVLQGRAALQRILDEGSADGPEIADVDSHLVGRLMELLTARSPIPPPRERGELKNTILVPPLSASSSSSSSSATDGHLELYGTRMAQVILVRRDGRVTYVERDIWALDDAGAATCASAHNTRSFTFRLGSD